MSKFLVGMINLEFAFNSDKEILCFCGVLSWLYIRIFWEGVDIIEF